MNNWEIVVTYTSYESDPGENYRTQKQYSGSVKELTELLENVPLSDFTIHLYRNWAREDFVELAKQLVKCKELAKPWIYAGSMY